MKNRQLWTHNFSEEMDISGESFPRQTIVELCGDRRVLIENHEGVSDYGPERIGVKVRFGLIVITGAQLRLCRMQAHQLIIIGKIQNVQIERGSC